MRIIIGGDCSIDLSECQRDFRSPYLKEVIVISEIHSSRTVRRRSLKPKDQAVSLFGGGRLVDDNLGDLPLFLIEKGALPYPQPLLFGNAHEDTDNLRIELDPG